jgi:hypothetical protein
VAEQRTERALDDEYLDVAVRAWAVREQPRLDEGQPGPPGCGSEPRVPDHFLVFDTETTNDPSQRLLFGCWRYVRVKNENGLELETLEEGLFYPNDLAEWYPEGYGTLQQIARERLRAGVDSAALDTAPALQVITLSAFLERKLWRAAYELRAGLVCFNFPFDISRLAWKVGKTRSRGKRPDPFEGGFSFALWGRDVDGEQQEGLYRPRIAIKSLDSKRALKEFRSAARVDEEDLVREDAARETKGTTFRGNFLDLRTLVFALTDRGHTLESACQTFGVPFAKRDVEHGQITREYVEYCREDVEATTRLCEASIGEFLKHPIDLPATRAFSPATIGKGYLKAMGVRPPLRRQEFDPRLLGWSMSAYYGGRAECRIRRTPVPVAYCDFLSMYPTVCALMKLWNLLTAAEIEVDDQAGDEVQQLLDEIDVDRCFDPELWPSLVGIVEIEPDGDIVPVRASYGASPNWQIGVNHLESSEPMWYTLADLVASKILTGKAPKIRRAIRLTPSPGRMPGLAPVDLLGATPVDPAAQDFFQTVVEERRRTEARNELPDAERAWRSKGLKVLANSTSYGIYAQMIRHELPGSRRDEVTVYGRGDQPHTFKVASPEDPGNYAFPPMAAAITGGARLLLALLERLVTDAGGTYAFCDTDSMAIAATEHGDLIACPGGSHETPDGHEAVNALSWEQVDEIRARFEQLKPYDPAIVKDDLLELEDENFDDQGERRELWCYGISAKRYVLYEYADNAELVLRAWTDIDTASSIGDAETPSIELLKPSEHGLGHLLNPTDPESDSRDWISEAWRLLLTTDPTHRDSGPEWLDRPAVARSTVSSPQLLQLFNALNDGKPYRDRIKPFNFLSTAFIPRPERPADDQRMVLMAPYENDARQWLETEWWNRYSARPYHLTLEPFRGQVRPATVRPRTYRDILAGYLANEEAKSLDPSGTLCHPSSRGLLRRRPARIRSVAYIGKESNRLEDAQAGLVEGLDEVVAEYDDYYGRILVPLVFPVLRELGVRETSRRTRHGLGAVSDTLAARARPRAASVARYVEVASEYARDQLRTHGAVPPDDSLAALRRYADTRGS